MIDRRQRQPASKEPSHAISVEAAVLAPPRQIWWVMTACGAAVLGFASNPAWAGESTERVVHLLEE
jgi:hypothetical protein